VFEDLAQVWGAAEPGCDAPDTTGASRTKCVWPCWVNQSNVAEALRAASIAGELTEAALARYSPASSRSSCQPAALVAQSGRRAPLASIRSSLETWVDGDAEIGLGELVRENLDHLTVGISDINRDIRTAG
jgi:hypothetical protein